MCGVKKTKFLRDKDPVLRSRENLVTVSDNGSFLKEVRDFGLKIYSVCKRGEQNSLLYRSSVRTNLVI